MFRIFCILLLDIVVLVTWDVVDPLQSEAVEISVKVKGIYNFKNTNLHYLKISLTTSSLL